VTRIGLRHLPRRSRCGGTGRRVGVVETRRRPSASGRRRCSSAGDEEVRMNTCDIETANVR
jgi:hypothetical protein